ncbi:MAG: hypothetical protein R3F49_24010 [Planctomycetota bacterium]
MAFEVHPDHEHPEIRNDGMKYEGLRFRAECRLAGRLERNHSAKSSQVNIGRTHMVIIRSTTPTTRTVMKTGPKIRSNRYDGATSFMSHP